MVRALAVALFSGAASSSGMTIALVPVAGGRSNIDARTAIHAGTLHQDCSGTPQTNRLLLRRPHNTLLAVAVPPPMDTHSDRAKTNAESINVFVSNIE